MTEISDEQSSEGIDIKRYLQIVRRRHMHFLIPLFLGWLIVLGSTWVLPVRYKSSTLILVEQPTMPKNYVEPNVSDDLQTRLQSITQQILSRTRLLLIIDKLHLYAENRRLLTPDQKVERMRKDIDIVLVRDSHGEQITAFKINYSARNPNIAQQVTGELSNLFISENLKVRQQQSEDTTKFIGSQLETARASLAEQEAKVREFKGQHEGELPSQEASNLQILSGLQAQLQNEEDTLNTAKQQRIYLQTLTDQYRSLHATSRTPDGAPTSLSQIDQELDRLRSKLAELSSRYTDRYPEVESLKDEIAKTEKRRDALKAKGSDTAQYDPADSPQNATQLQLKGQLQANQAEIVNREKAIVELKGRVNGYQDRLNTAPVREQQLADLTRGYDQSKANYDQLLKKQNDSEMATSMEHMQQGERFSVLDPPDLPLKPDFPNRLKFCGIGLGFGLVLGLSVVGVLEFLDDRLHSEKEIKTLLPMGIISEIPDVVSPSDEQNNTKKMVLGWAMAGLVLATILAGSAFSYLHD
ncbi:GumC family protein [Tunturiibacter lichenicola]|uniref:GumC family protein n=1 Tax=Tunturiibacter lichenicola TaxID=2051959 RepID=UPI003D9AD55A